MHIRDAAFLGPCLVALALAGISHALNHFGNLLGPPFTIALLCLSIPLLIVGFILRHRQSRQSDKESASVSDSIVHQSVSGSQDSDISSNQLIAVVGDRNVVQVAPQPVSEPHSREIDLLYDRLQGAKILVDSGRHQAAIDTLKRLREEASDSSLPANFHATLSNRLGVAYLGINRLEDAELELRTAIAIMPNHSKAMINLASLMIHKGNPQEALCITEEILEDLPGNPSIAAIRIQALYKMNRGREIQVLIERFPHAAATTVVKETLARIELADGRPGVALSLAREVVEVEPDEPSYQYLLGQCLLADVIEEVGTHPPVPWLLEASLEKQIWDATAALTVAVASLEQREEPESLRSALLNRAHARMILQRLDEAFDDCRRARRLGKDDDDLRELTARILLQLGQPLEAHDLLSAIEREDARARLLPQQASALIGASMIQEAIELLRSKWDSIPEEYRSVEIGSMLVDAYMNSDNYGEAAAIVDSLKADNRDDGEVLRVSARFAAKSGRTAEASILFEEALTKAEENDKDWIALDYADFLSANGDFDRAVELYDGRVPINRPSPFLRNYLFALWNADELARLFDVSGRIRAAGINEEIVDELHAKCLIEAGDLVGAKAVWQSLIDGSDSPSRFRLEAAITAFQAGDQDRARHLVSRLSVQDLDGEPLALMQLAQLRHSLALEDVLPYAYAALRHAPGDDKMHGTYIRVLQCREDIESELLASEMPQVGTDTTVFLRSEGRQTEFTIHSRMPPNPTSEDISESDATAVKLLGMLVGGQVDFDAGRSFEITEIRSKYAVAASRTMTEFEDRFPDNPALRSFPVDPEFAALKEQVTKRNKFIESVIAHYRERAIPLATVAQTTNASTIEVWGTLTSRSNEDILAWQGGALEVQEAIEGAKRVVAVMDSTALLALATIGQLETVRSMVPRLVVPQAVLDEFTDHYVWTFQGKKPVGRISSEGDRLTYELHSEDDWQASKNFIDEIIRFIICHTDRTPAPTYLELDPDQRRKLISIIGKSSLIPILVAAELNAPLYSDDHLLRSLAQNEYDVRGIWSGAVMAAARDATKISDDEYSKSICSLISLNYSNVPIGPADLVWMFKHEDQQSSDLFRRVARQLSVPNCDEASAVTVAAEATKLAVASLSLVDRRRVFVDELIRALLSGRQGTSILEDYKRHLRVIASRPALPESIWAEIDRLIENRSGPTPLAP